MSHNCFPSYISSWKLLSLYTYHHETSHTDSPCIEDVCYGFRGQKVKGQGHNALMTWNVFFGTWLLSLFTYRHENSHTDSPWVKDVPFWICGQKVKGQSHNAFSPEKKFRVHNCFLFTPIILKLYTDCQWVDDVPYWIWGQKVKGQGHNALMAGNGFWCIIPFPNPLSPWNFNHRLPTRQGCVLLILGSKG